MMKIDLTQTHDVDGAYQSIDLTEIKSKYKDPGTKYCFDVLDKKIQAGYSIKLACFRHLRDLQRQETKDFPYHYDFKAAKMLLKFASIAPNVDTGEPTELMDWQKFIFCMMLGWRDEDDFKRFTRVIVSVARGQGKTYLMAILVAYSYLVESLKLENQDYLVSSINYKQTMKIFGYIKSMLRKIIDIEPFKTLANEAGLELQSEQIIEKKTNNILRAISHEAGQFDSYHFRTAVFDEIGEITTRDRVSKIVSGQVKVQNHQFVQISTAYPDPTVPFHEDEKIIIQAMEQDFKRNADSYLGLMWAQDDMDEVYKPETWVKSNPLLDLPDQKENLMSGLKDKRDSDLLTGNISDFENKNLNLWLKQSTASYLTLKEVEDAIDDDFKIDGRQVYIGLDYSMFSDNTAVAFVYPYKNNKEEPRWHIAQHSFIPWRQAGSLEAKEKKDGINYHEFPQFCTITEQIDGIINPEQVYKWIVKYVEDHRLKVVFLGYDHYGSFQVKNITESLSSNQGWLIQDIKQISGEISDPTKFLQECFSVGKITRFNDPIMEKALLNASMKEDKIGIQVVKDKATFKIDVVDALIDAMYQAMNHFEKYGIVNDKSTEVKRMTQEQVLEWFNNPESGLLGGDEDINQNIT